MLIGSIFSYGSAPLEAQCVAPTGLDSIIWPGAINISSLWDEETTAGLRTTNNGPLTTDN